MEQIQETQVTHQVKTKGCTWQLHLFNDLLWGDPQPKFTIGKRFWSYIRLQKKDQIGVPMLKEGEKESIDGKMKAELISIQYEFVYEAE